MYRGVTSTCNIDECEISDSRSSNFEDCCLLGCDISTLVKTGVFIFRAEERSTLKIEAASSFKIFLPVYQTTQYHIQEGSNLQ